MQYRVLYVIVITTKQSNTKLNKGGNDMIQKIKSIFKKSKNAKNENIVKMQNLYRQNDELLKKLLREASI